MRYGSLHMPPFSLHAALRQAESDLAVHVECVDDVGPLVGRRKDRS